MIDGLGFDLININFSRGFGLVYALLCRLQVYRHI